jgi:hypothetical protein
MLAIRGSGLILSFQLWRRNAELAICDDKSHHSTEGVAIRESSRQSLSVLSEVLPADRPLDRWTPDRA